LSTTTSSAASSVESRSSRVRVSARPRRRGVALSQRDARAIALVGDALAAATASLIAPDVWAAFDPSYVPTAGVPYWQLASIPVWLLALRLAGVNDLRAGRISLRPLVAVGRALIAMIALVLVMFYVQPFFAPRGSTFISLPIVAASVVVWRLLYGRILSSNAFDEHVAIVGVDEGARRTAQAILSSSSYRLRAFLAADPEPAAIYGVPVLAVEDDLWAVAQDLGVDKLVVGNTRSLPAMMLNDLVRCFDHGVETVPATTVYEEISGRVLASALEADWYAELPTQAGGPYAVLKRLVDISVGSALLVTSLPVMLLIAAAIWLDSRGPVLLRQVRVGRRGNLFVLHKFRTMRRDAELIGHPVWASVNDARVTRVGRFLRRSRLDELPQLWDVVRGAMSLIGPRPERPEFVERLATELPLFRARTLVRPGISGWAQVEYRYAGNVADNLTKLEYDLFYLRHLGPLIDLNIALRTLIIVAGFRGQ
jgi:exopolysaccharide biosynthesis polyprenyl glycosylphosphotransferase